MFYPSISQQNWPSNFVIKPYPWLAPARPFIAKQRVRLDRFCHRWLFAETPWSYVFSLQGKIILIIKLISHVALDVWRASKGRNLKQDQGWLNVRFALLFPFSKCSGNDFSSTGPPLVKDVINNRLLIGQQSSQNSKIRLKSIQWPKVHFLKYLKLSVMGPSRFHQLQASFPKIETLL